ncbi:uncharacterized protein LY89DRAFT_718732 [Mollisia scopiformis]|uniref:BTB domain-containing protein n=1 Tax=Mollisia scopiformis TaxID=149040 RepID=A0A194XA38_MOLSC|nr:uncharacterized protein LY89DRAFT_718732 [Mollisia scopiformis]KUJ17038.1 hypothetical protein LY89DRAFT_718732 [Mollisia scopiformis]
MSTSTSQPEGISIADELGLDTVKLIVGSGDQKCSFAVHKNPLCKKIPYFDTMLHSKFKEALTDQAEFQEDLPVAFRILINWIYQRKVKALPPSDPRSGGLSQALQLLQLCILAEKLMATQLLDDALAALSKQYMYTYATSPENSNPFEVTPAELCGVYNELPEHSKVRTWVVRVIAHQFSIIRRKDYNNSAFQELLADNFDPLGEFLTGLRMDKHENSDISAYLYAMPPPNHYPSNLYYALPTQQR